MVANRAVGAGCANPGQVAFQSPMPEVVRSLWSDMFHARVGKRPETVDFNRHEA